MFDLDEGISRLYKGELLSDREIATVCTLTKELLSEEPNIVLVETPVSVCGDLHGQFNDLLELFRVEGKCPDVNYLFLGDFVDRGAFGVEVISLLCCLKLRYPRNIVLIRGNHESRGLTRIYGFYQECIRKYGAASSVWASFTDLFETLPLGALVDGEILGIHGGLSPSLQTLDQIVAIDRFQEVPQEGPFADLVWSDPSSSIDGFQLSPRGAGYTFGRDVAEAFLHFNGLRHVTRAHQLCMEGYQLLFDGAFSTVWSAPNYCNRFGNLASVMTIRENLQLDFNVFSSAPDVEPSAGSVTKEGTKGSVVDEYFL